VLIDTHCHIHDVEYPLDIDQTIKRAHENGVEKMICIGTSQDDSRRAISFAASHDDIFCAVGVHPHESKNGYNEIDDLIDLNNSSLVAVGEIGLDYHYDFSPRNVQIEALQAQIELALRYDLPIIFHVREAFDDFWPIFDNFHGIRGVVHSFTDTPYNACQALNRELYVGISGFSTFTKDKLQQTMFSSIPMNKTLLETDAPYLTPVPLRGKVNEPAYVRSVAEHQSVIRNISLNEITDATTKNAFVLFNLKNKHNQKD